MVAKGKDASDLFPAVVKNVVSKNLEVRHFKIEICGLPKFRGGVVFLELVLIGAFTGLVAATGPGKWCLHVPCCYL